MKKKEIKWVEELSWQEMRDSGLLWFVNSLLHLFGRAIVFDFGKSKNGKLGKLKRVYFARCRYRGFDSKTGDSGYTNLTDFLSKNIKELKKDIRL